MNLYLHLKWAFLECCQTDFLPQPKQSVTLLTRGRCRTVNISSGHHTYSIKVEKPSEPSGTFQICFWYFISFTMKNFSPEIFKTRQTEVAPNMKLFTRH